jgi:hypothetical protein
MIHFLSDHNKQPIALTILFCYFRVTKVTEKFRDFGISRISKNLGKTTFCRLQEN